MEQLDLLWKYQELDLQIDEYEAEKKNSPLRQKLIKLLQYLKEQQKQLINLNDELEKKAQAYNKVRHEFENIKNSLKSDEEWLASDLEKDLKRLDEVEEKLMKAKEKLKQKQKELQTLIKDIESLKAQLDEVRVNINKGKKEYAEVKQKYDAEISIMEENCEKIRKQQEELERKVDKNLLNKYKSLKGSRITAIASIEQDRCGGCNMSLASLVIQRVKEHKTIVECENCGRILYIATPESNDLEM